MKGVTPSTDALYDGVPLEPAPSVRQVPPAPRPPWASLACVTPRDPHCLKTPHAWARLMFFGGLQCFSLACYR